MAKKKPEPQWTWAPSKTDKPKVPDDLKKEVQAKADDLVATGGGRRPGRFCRDDRLRP